MSELRTLEPQSGIDQLSKVKHRKMGAGITLGETLYGILLKSQCSGSPLGSSI